MHRADVDRVRGLVKPHAPRDGMDLRATARFLAYAARKGGLRTTYLSDVVPVDDGRVLDLPGSPRVVGLSGHSPGSIAVHVPAVDALFFGDPLTTRRVLTGRTEPQPAPFTDDPAGALASLDRLAGLEAAWGLPGHGAPWTRGADEAVRTLRAAPSDSG